MQKGSPEEYKNWPLGHWKRLSGWHPLQPHLRLRCQRKSEKMDKDNEEPSTHPSPQSVKHSDFVNVRHRPFPWPLGGSTNIQVKPWNLNLNVPKWTTDRIVFLDCPPRGSWRTHRPGRGRRMITGHHIHNPLHHYRRRKHIYYLLLMCTCDMIEPSEPNKNQNVS